MFKVEVFPFGAEVDIKNERKSVSKMWENAYLSIKTQKLPRPLSGPWTSAADSSQITLTITLFRLILFNFRLRHCMLMVTVTTTPMTKCDNWCACYVNGSWCRVMVTLGMSLSDEAFSRRLIYRF